MTDTSSVESRIVKFACGRRYRPMTAAQMADALKVPSGERKAFFDRIEALKLAGELVEVKKRRLADPSRVDLVVGALQCNPRGFGFIRPVREADGEDVYVSGENMSGALHGDLVVARVPQAFRKAQKDRGRGARRDKGAEVKIVSVLQRARTEIVGTFRQDRRVRCVIPDNPRLFRDVIVAAEDAHGARSDDKVRVRVTAWPTRHMGPEGKVVEVFGPRGQLEAELKSVASEYELRLEFPPAVLRAAERVPKTPRPKELKGRADLTAEQIFTIDPADARDFDDAVCLRRLPGGDWELGVHIADVAHYVKPDSPIDREALLRGTSVYLPGQVVPMLPEALSNNACSLRPNEVHLTRTVRMRIDPKGHVKKADVFKSYVKSARRFTYEEVQAVIQGGKLRKGEAALRRTLLQMHELAEALRQRRRQAGMLELAIPEAHILTDDKGRTTGVQILRTDESHRLIEQFMLAANEAVADHLIREGLPYLCRAHDEPTPEMLQEYREVARSLGHNLPKPGTRKQLQRFLDGLRGGPDEPVLHYLLLRSMMQAEYSAERRPHYAIAAPNYLHFTSPIRRYPDLLAHRILAEAETGRIAEPGRKAWWRKDLPVWLNQANKTERNAAWAERELTGRRLMAFIAENKAPMDALITSVESYGMRVQLCDSLVQGVVRMSALDDGFYRVDRQVGALVAGRGKRYRVGQTIKVRVLRYDEFKRQIEFEPAAGRRQRSS